MAQLSKDQHEAIQALERLSVRRHVLTVDEARAIARQIAGDPAFEFPPKPAPREAQAPAQPEPPAEPVHGSNGSEPPPAQE